MAIPFALPLQSPITDENKLAASENVPDSLGDIALAGDNIEFKPETEPNYSVVGTPTIEDNIVSGFNSSSCLTTENPFIAEECTGIEIVLVFEVPAAVGVPMIANAVPGVAPYFRVIMGSSGSLAIRYTDTLGEEKIASTRAFITANTKNWYKAVYDASTETWTHYNSTDEGATWTQLNRAGNYSNAPSLETGNLLYWGKNGENQGVTYFNGKIYLEDCYIKTTSASGEKTLKFFKETGKTTVSATIPQPDLTGYLQNLATGTNSFSVNTDITTGNATSYGIASSVTGPGGIAVGWNSKAAQGSVAVGVAAQTTVKGSIALGGQARATATRAIQIGYGTNSEANSVYMSTSETDNWKLLGSDGKIPAARLPDASYKSLNETQKTQLLLDGTYDGSEVADGEIFTEYDGKFVEHKITTHTASEAQPVVTPIASGKMFYWKGALYKAPKNSTTWAKSLDEGNTWETFTSDKSTGSYPGQFHPFGDILLWTQGNVSAKTIMYYSTDGKTWSQSSTAEYNTLVGELNGKIFFRSVSGQSLIVSSDGISWSSVTLPETSVDFVYLILNGKLFAYTARQSDAKVYISEDEGSSWTVSQTSSSWRPWATYAYVSSANGIAIATNGYSYGTTTPCVSTDGINWTTISGIDNNWNNLCYLPEKDIYYFYPGALDDINTIYSSKDCRTWNTVSLPAAFDDFGLAYSSNAIYFGSTTSSSTTMYKMTGESWEEYSLTDLSYNKAEVDAAGYLKNASSYARSLAIDKGVIGNSYGATEIAIGSGDQDIVASGQGAIAIGSALSGETYPTKASGQGAIAIGKNAQDTYELGLAIGFGARVNNRYSIALGANAETPGYQAIALGYHAKASAGNAIQIGYGTNSTANTMNVGLSNSLNVQLLSADGTIPAERLVNAPAPDLTGYVQNTATGTDALTLLGTATNSTKALNIGVGSQATNVCTTVVGNTARASGGGATAIGCNARATAYCATAIGGSNSADASYASSTDAIALGHYARATADSAIQIGYGENNTAHTLAIGLSHNDTYTLLKSDGTIPGERMSLQGTTAPDTTTVGSIGQFYVDTTTSTGYMCVGVDTTTPSYTWKQITYSPVGTEYILEAGNWNAENNSIEISIPGLTIGTPMWIAPTVSEDNSNELNYTTHGIRLKAQQADSIILSCTIIPTENISITIIR